MPSKQRKNTGANRRSPSRWSFQKGKYLSTPSISPNSVSTGASVDALRGALGLGSGSYDGAVREAVMDAQSRLDLPVTGVVTEEDWDAIVNAEGQAPTKVRKQRAARRSPAPAGGVNGADKPNATAEGSGKLDPPEGPQ